MAAKTWQNIYVRIELKFSVEQKNSTVIENRNFLKVFEFFRKTFVFDKKLFVSEMKRITY